MKRLKIGRIVFLAAAILFSLPACGGRAAEGSEENTYRSITTQEAKDVMDSETGYLILDVRTQEEYEEGHIMGAVLIPDYEIAERAEKELPDKEQLILVYCRSGRRSKGASAELASMGYKNVREFGGIIDWPFDVTK